MQNILIAVGVIVVLGVVAITFMGSDTVEPEPVVVAPTEMDETSANPQEDREMAEAEPDIVDTAMAADDFNTLVAAVAAAGLVDTLKGPGPFTVFAPTDAAFADLPAGTVDTLLMPENQTDLANILTYHVVPSAVLSTGLSDGMEVVTVNGEILTIGVTDAGVTVNGANVVTADIQTSNGVIHVIDSVLLPPTE